MTVHLNLLKLLRNTVSLFFLLGQQCSLCVQKCSLCVQTCIQLGCVLYCQSPHLVFSSGHDVTVAARSDVFSAMFEHEMEERKHVSSTRLCVYYANGLQID